MPLSVESGVSKRFATRTCYTDCRKPSWFLEVYSKSEIFVGGAQVGNEFKFHGQFHLNSIRDGGYPLLTVANDKALVH